MARFIKRFYGKKRGDHNMRSDKLGGATLGIFFAVFFFGGCIALALVLINVTIPDWRINFGYHQTTCQVLDKRVEPDTYSRGGPGDSPSYRPEMQISYKVGEQPYTRWSYDLQRTTSSDRAGSQVIIDRFKVGDKIPCWYDPLNPEQVVLIRGHHWSAWLYPVLPLSFIVIGGGGLLFTFLNWGKSAEHRSALAQRSARLDPFETPVRDPDSFPNVPKLGNMTDSPGTRLAYRLPSATPRWALLGLVLITLMWTGGTAILATLSIRAHVSGHPNWYLTIAVIPFALVGAGLVMATSRELLIISRIGPTIVEIDTHPLLPGRPYQVFIAQGGRLRLRLFTVSLVCEEHARYQQGTNLRTETRRVFDQEIFRGQEIEVLPGQTFEVQREFQIPATAMHSFVANHNRILWLLVVKGNITGWPDFERAYTLHVYPTVRQSVPV